MSNVKKTIEVSSVSFPLNKRLVLKKMFIPLLLLVSLWIFFGEHFFAIFWIPLILFLLTIFFAVFNYFYLKVLYYHLENSYILIKRYAIIPKEIVIEYVNIKDVVISQDILDKLFGLYQVKFNSNLMSPSARKMAYIEGLDQVEAHELKVVIDHLIEKAKDVR
jgi:membrane protein YdbS with pleckstrin-like domain